MTRPYNPLDKVNLAQSVVNAMLCQDVRPLGTLEKFEGAGLYAIYYAGNEECYRALAERNRNGQFSVPIYVGKAVPEGARKGGLDFDAPQGTVLFKRLQEHAGSIRAAANLEIGDFFCRFLVADDIWIPLGESLLISRLAPVWNRILDGFGNHDPGSGRHSGKRSKWDTLHPGRAWACRCEVRPESAEKLAEEVRAFLENRRL